MDLLPLNAALTAKMHSMELDLTLAQRYRASSDLGQAFFTAEIPGLQTLAAFGVNRSRHAGLR